MAGPTRLELATSGVTGRRSNQLNYDPAVVVFEAGSLPEENPSDKRNDCGPGSPLSPDRKKWWAEQGSNL